MDLTRNKITTALNKLNLSENANVTLKYKAGTQVFHYTGDYLDDALSETNALYDVARVVAHEGLRKNNSLINFEVLMSMLAFDIKTPPNAEIGSPSSANL